MGKILFISLIVISSLVFTYIVEYDGFVLIQTNSYEIKTNIKNMFFVLLLSLIIVVFVLQIMSILGKPNTSRYDRKINKIKSNYENYISSIEVAYYELLSNNLSIANKYLKKAGLLLPNRQLTTLIKIKSSILSKNYDKSLDLLRNINNKNVYLRDNILLKEYIEKNNIDLMKETAERIILNRKNDYLAVTTLYKIYKENKNWSKCKELLKIIKNEKYFTDDELKLEVQLIDINSSSSSIKHNNIFHNFIIKIKTLFKFKKRST